MEVTCHITQSGAKKLSPEVYNKLLSNTLDDACLEAESYMGNTGTGVKGGAEPSGGAPRDTGYLSDTLNADLSNMFTKSVSTKAPYWAYVVYGTSSIKPNNFPKRAWDDVIKRKVVEESVNKQLHILGLR